MHYAEWESYTMLCLLALSKLGRNAWVSDDRTRKEQDVNKKSSKGLAKEGYVTLIGGLWCPHF